MKSVSHVEKMLCQVVEYLVAVITSTSEKLGKRRKMMQIVIVGILYYSMYVCVCAFMHVGVHAWIWVVDVCMHVCIRACASMYKPMQACMCVEAFVMVSVSMHMCVCLRIRLCMRVSVSEH